MSPPLPLQLQAPKSHSLSAQEVLPWTHREFERRFLSEHYQGGTGALEVAMLWREEIMRVDTYNTPQPITIGCGGIRGRQHIDIDPNYLVEHSTAGIIHTLLAPHNDGKQSQWVVNIRPRMRGFVLFDPPINGQQKFSFNEALDIGLALPTARGLAVPLMGGSRVKVRVGNVTFLIHFISSAPLTLEPFLSAPDRLLRVSFLIAMLLACAFGGLVSSAPVRQTNMRSGDTIEGFALEIIDGEDTAAQGSARPIIPLHKIPKARADFPLLKNFADGLKVHDKAVYFYNRQEYQTSAKLFLLAAERFDPSSKRGTPKPIAVAVETSCRNAVVALQMVAAHATISTHMKRLRRHRPYCYKGFKKQAN